MRTTGTPIWPFGLFLLSGFAGLVLEAVLLRHLALLFGNSASATALVLAAFMGGLAWGAVLFGGRADRSASPIRLFGLLELGTALSGAALVWLLGHGREWLIAPVRLVGPGMPGRILTFVVAFMLVLVPTVLMGGTLPALARGLVRRRDRFVTAFGLLYGLNTLGAAAGVFCAGFFLFERLGISATGWFGATIQAVVGLVAIVVAGAGAGATRRESSAVDTAPAAGVDKPGADVEAAAAWTPLLAAGVGGFAVLGYEVLWTRLLSLSMRSFSYSFSLMLALFLVGLCVGAVLLGLAGPHVRRPLWLLGWIQLAMGVWVAGSFVWMPALLAPVNASDFDGFLLRSALRAAPIVLPPTILSGMALPLAARAFWGRAGAVGRDVGLVYGVNTGGAILGSLVAGLVLLPLLGAPVSLVVLATLNAAAGAAVLCGVGARRSVLVAATALTLGCLLPLATGTGRFVDAFLRATRNERTIGEVLYYDEGPVDTVAIVTRDYGFHDPDAKSLITNGVAMSASVKPVWRYMALEGHLPVLLAREPRTALAVGVGTGITLGAVASHPSLESITAIELSGGVIGGLSWFAAENGRAWEDPRVRLIREDGRHWLELSPERFDVITLEPPPPIVAGSVHLYSRDFYDLCRHRLADGGVVAQWLPLHAQSLESARMTARTFLDAFPEVMLWLPSVRDAVLVGSTEPLGLDMARLRAAWSVPVTRANLTAAYLESPESFAATFLLDRAGIDSWAGQVLPITDEHPRMEFFRHQGGNMSDPDIATLLDLPQADWKWLRGATASTSEILALENRALRFYARAAVDDDPNAGVTAARLGLGTEFFLYPLGCTTDQLERLRDRPDAAPHVARCAGLRAVRGGPTGPRASSVQEMHDRWRARAHPASSASSSGGRASPVTVEVPNDQRVQ